MNQDYRNAADPIAAVISEIRRERAAQSNVMARYPEAELYPAWGSGWAVHDGADNVLGYGPTPGEAWEAANK